MKESYFLIYPPKHLDDLNHIQDIENKLVNFNDYIYFKDYSISNEQQKRFNSVLDTCNDILSNQSILIKEYFDKAIYSYINFCDKKTIFPLNEWSKYLSISFNDIQLIWIKLNSKERLDFLKKNVILNYNKNNQNNIIKNSSNITEYFNNKMTSYNYNYLLYLIYFDNHQTNICLNNNKNIDLSKSKNKIIKELLSAIPEEILNLYILAIISKNNVILDFLKKEIKKSTELKKHFDKNINDCNYLNNNNIIIKFLFFIDGGFESINLNKKVTLNSIPHIDDKSIMELFNNFNDKNISTYIKNIIFYLDKENINVDIKSYIEKTFLEFNNKTNKLVNSNKIFKI